MDCFGIQSNHYFTEQINSNDPSSEFQFSDFLTFEDDFLVEDSLSSQSLVSSENISGGSSGFGDATSRDSNIKNRNGVKRKMEEEGTRVAFRTKSEMEIMDDGFKWRKYGKKSVKNSPNPRNYYRCSSGGCTVKKTVQRDREDPSYVITTYDGIHNHESPSVVYYNQMPLVLPSNWSLQPPSSSSL